MGSQAQYRQRGAKSKLNPLPPEILQTYPNDSSTSDSDDESMEMIEFMEQDLLKWINDCVKRYQSLMEAQLSLKSSNTDSSLGEYHGKTVEALKNTFIGETYRDILEESDANARLQMRQLFSNAKTRLEILLNTQFNEVYLKKQQIQRESVVKKVEILLNEAETLYDEHEEQFNFKGKSRTEIELVHEKWAEDAINLFDQLLEDNHLQNMDIWRQELIQRLNERLEDLLDECFRTSTTLITPTTTATKTTTTNQISTRDLILQAAYPRGEKSSNKNTEFPVQTFFQEKTAFATKIDKSDNFKAATQPEKQLKKERQLKEQRELLEQKQFKEKKPFQQLEKEQNEFQQKEKERKEFQQKEKERKEFEEQQKLNELKLQENPIWKTEPVNSKPTKINSTGHSILPPVVPWEPSKRKIKETFSYQKKLESEPGSGSEEISKPSLSPKPTWKTAPQKSGFSSTVERPILPPVEPWQPAKSKIFVQKTQSSNASNATDKSTKPSREMERRPPEQIFIPISETPQQIIPPVEPWKPTTQSSSSGNRSQEGLDGDPWKIIPSIESWQQKAIDSKKITSTVITVRPSQEHEREKLTKGNFLENDSNLHSSKLLVQKTIVAQQTPSQNLNINHVEKSSLEQPPEQTATLEIKPLAAPRQRALYTVNTVQAQLPLEDSSSSESSETELIMPQIQQIKQTVTQQAQTKLTPPALPLTAPRQLQSQLQTPQQTTQKHLQLQPQQQSTQKQQHPEQQPKLQPNQQTPSPETTVHESVKINVEYQPAQSTPPAISQQSTLSTQSTTKLEASTPQTVFHKPTQFATEINSPSQSQNQNQLKHQQPKPEPKTALEKNRLMNQEKSREITLKESPKPSFSQPPAPPPPPAMTSKRSAHKTITKKALRQLSSDKAAQKPSSQLARHTSIITITEKLPDAGIGIFLDENTFKIGFYEQNEEQDTEPEPESKNSFTEILSVTPEVCFHDKYILIGKEAYTYSEKHNLDRNCKYFNIFQLLFSTKDTKFAEFNIDNKSYTLCTHEIIAVFLYTLLNSVLVGIVNRVKITKIIFSIPFTPTSSVKERLRISSRIAGFPQVRILSSLLSTAISTLSSTNSMYNNESNYANGYKDMDGRKLGPFASTNSPRYVFVMDIHRSSFTVGIVQISPTLTSLSVKNPYGTDNLTEFLPPDFAHWHESLYEGQNITPPSKEHVRRIYEKAISYVSKDVRDFILDCIVTNGRKYPIIEEMVLNILEKKFSVLNPSVVGIPLLGVSLLASCTIKIKKDDTEVSTSTFNYELPSTIQCHDSSRSDLGLATGFKGEKKKRFRFMSTEFLNEEDDCVLRQVYSLPLPFNNSQPVRFYVQLDELYGENIFRVSRYQLVFTFGSKHFERKLRDYITGKDFKLEIECLVDEDGVLKLKASCLCNSPVEFEMNRLDNVCSCGNPSSSVSSDFRKVIEICNRVNANSVRI